MVTAATGNELPRKAHTVGDPNAPFSKTMVAFSRARTWNGRGQEREESNERKETVKASETVGG